MAAPSINSTAVPARMANTGPYIFRRQTARTNGAGQTVRAGSQSIEWSLGTLTPADLEWWTDTILSGADSATITAELWDDLGNEIAITSAVLHRPEPGQKQGGLYRNVVIRITQILPILD